MVLLSFDRYRTDFIDTVGEFLGHIDPRGDFVEGLANLTDRSVIDCKLVAGLCDLDHRQSCLQVLDLDFQFPLCSEHFVEFAPGCDQIAFPSIEYFDQLIGGRFERLVVLEPVAQILSDLFDAVLFALVGHIADTALQVLFKLENRVLGFRQGGLFDVDLTLQFCNLDLFASDEFQVACDLRLQIADQFPGAFDLDLDGNLILDRIPQGMDPCFDIAVDRGTQQKSSSGSCQRRTEQNFLEHFLYPLLVENRTNRRVEKRGPRGHFAWDFKILSPRDDFLAFRIKPSRAIGS